jgi:hypothetical protein
VSGRLDLEAAGAPAEPRRPEAAAGVTIAIDESAIESALPADHPAWTRDRLSLSSQARALLARIKPAVVTVLAFFDHRLRSVFVGGRKLSIDASGSYRLDAFP